ncbi:MAG: hypothetical protein ACQXXH_04690 [Candidatus Bathyarchaeia archaeon]|nr:hypothetical protein [Candidatus Bathyarchaeota archaeon A05DMB-4]MDH7595033.1 hypothetical protein [Candidatus Bathyarchaeota archaeon]
MPFATTNASQPLIEAGAKGNSHLKLLEVVRALQPDDKILVWIDINATGDRFGGHYLPADPSLYGIKWTIITFAPDMEGSKLFWCLAEVQAQSVEEMLRIPWVFDMALVRVGGLGNEPPVSSKLSHGFHEAIDRAMQYNGTLQLLYGCKILLIYPRN